MASKLCPLDGIWISRFPAPLMTTFHGLWGTFRSNLSWNEPKNFKALYPYKFDQKQQEGVLTTRYWCALHSGKFGKSILWKMSLLLKPDEMFLWSDITIKKKINSREKNNCLNISDWASNTQPKLLSIYKINSLEFLEMSKQFLGKILVLKYLRQMFEKVSGAWLDRNKWMQWGKKFVSQSASCWHMFSITFRERTLKKESVSETQTFSCVVLLKTCHSYMQKHTYLSREGGWVVENVKMRRAEKTWREKHQVTKITHK